MKFLSRLPRLERRNTRGRMRQRRSQPSRPTACFRPRLECLEERTLLSAAATSAALQASYGQLPLAFTVNEGQSASPINYVAHGSGYSIALTAQQAQLSLGQGNTSTTLDLQLVGANASGQAIGQDELITKTNYLTGNDPSKWLTNIANYGQVEYQNVYKGVDAVYSGNQGQLETTFLIHPGASACVIQMQVQGAQSLSLDSQGDLVIHTSGGDVIEQAPIAYQNINGLRQAVSSRFVLEGNNQVVFEVGAYDPSQTLVIDPTLTYSTYLGGADTYNEGIAVDSSGNAYLATGLWPASGGSVEKLNASGTAVIYDTVLTSGTVTAIAVDSAGDAYVLGSGTVATTANAFSTSGPGTFVSELNPTGSGLIYSTYLPGAAISVPEGGPNVLSSPGGGIAVDSAGKIYLTGPAVSGLPTTAGAFQSTFTATGNGNTNAFLAKFDPNLSGSASLVYCTYLGGSVSDEGTGVAVDSSGNAYLTGITASANFPTTAGAFQTKSDGGVFVAKINPSLSGSASLLFSTYLGEGGNSIVTLFGVLFCATGPGIAVDGSGNAYVAGMTGSTNFPTTPGAYQTSNPHDFTNAFVSKLNPTGSQLVYSTYLGALRVGAPHDSNTAATCIAVDGSGNAYVAGFTFSHYFPTVNAIQKSNGSTAGTNAFVTTFNATGSALLFSTYLGGSKFPGPAHDNDVALGIAVDSAGNTYVAGVATSTNFPTTSGAYDTSFPGGSDAGFVTKIDPPADSSSDSPATAALTSGMATGRGQTTTKGARPQGQENSVQLAPSPSDPLFTLIGNNPAVNAPQNVLASLLSEWQSLESALLSRFDALLSMGFGASTHNDTPDTQLRDLLFASLSSSNAM